MREHYRSISLSVAITIRYMRTECMDHEYVYGRKMPMEMLVRQVAESDFLKILFFWCLEEHFCTLTYERRPYGVGLLIGGVDVFLSFFRWFLSSPKVLISSIHLPLASTSNTARVRSALAVRARRQLCLDVFWTKKRTWWRWAMIVWMEWIERSTSW